MKPLLWVHEISPSPWTMNWQRVPRSGRRKREQKALERNFDRFRFRVRKRTWKRGSLCPVLIFLAQMFFSTLMTRATSQAAHRAKPCAASDSCTNAHLDTGASGIRRHTPAKTLSCGSSGGRGGHSRYPEEVRRWVLRSRSSLVRRQCNGSWVRFPMREDAAQQD